MIELLGIGVRGAGDRWLLRRASARLPAGELVAVVADRVGERDALLDAILGRRIADEGRVWIDATPVVRATARRIRAMVREVAPDPDLARRSALRRAFDRWVGTAPPADRELHARLSVTDARARGARYLVARDIDVTFGTRIAPRVLDMLRAVAHTDRVSVIVSLAATSLAGTVVDRLLQIREGALVSAGENPRRLEKDFLHSRPGRKRHEFVINT